MFNTHLKPFLLGTLLSLSWPVLADTYDFTDADIAFLAGFSLEALSPLPEAKSNRLADETEAAELGQALFFDPRLSGNGQVSCATCHQPAQYFTDGLPQSQALGTTRRNAPSIPNSLHGPWQFWDGRADSLWAQALSPLEDQAEHGIDRTSAARLLVTEYSEAYEQIFGDTQEAGQVAAMTVKASPLTTQTEQENWQALSEAEQQAVNRVFSQMGKLMMAYERKLALQPARFDDFIAQLQSGADRATLTGLMSEDEVRGMRLFMGPADCASCHNGPLFTNFEFHNIGAPEPDETQVDMGRYTGIEKLQQNEFSCVSQWSDLEPEQCLEMAFLKTQGPELVGAFKTPSLRNVAETAPYMQAGQVKTLEEVVRHYNEPTPPFYDREQHPSRPHFDIIPLNLTETELQQLVAFLGSLTSPLPEDDPWWWAPERSSLDTQ